MTSLVGALLGLIAGGSILLAVYGLQRRPRDNRPRRQASLVTRWGRATGRPPGARGRRRDVKVAVVAGASLLVFAATGWVVSLILIPAAVLLVPWLLANQNIQGIERTAALETWVRSLRSLLQGGSENTLESALQSSLATAPLPIHAEVSALVARMNARWATDRALARFADELDDATSDTVAAALMLASRRRGYGLAEVLAGLSESVADEVRARRRIESDRGLPRIAAKYLTVGGAALALLLAVFRPSLLAPYATPLGQLILLVIIAVYLATLFLLRRITATKDRPRLYPVASGGGGQHVR